MDEPQVRRTGRTVHTVNLPWQATLDWSQRVLHLADLHLDNPHADVDLVRRVLEQAREYGARVNLYGDTFCAMGGKYDPRSSKGRDHIRPELNVANYVDAMVEWCADVLGPYADIIDVIGYGNHETSILKRLETDLVQRLVAVLNDRHGASVHAGSYAGWLVYRFRTDSRQVRTHNVHYDHGSGGGGPVTRGVIGTNRRAVYLPDAQTVVTGHIHENWLVTIERERIDRTGRAYIDTQTHLCVGTAKEERLQGIGYHVERGRPPKPLRWWWQEFYHYRPSAKVSRTRPALVESRYIQTDRM